MSTPFDLETVPSDTFSDNGQSGSLWFKPENTKPVYPALAHHQLSEEGWDLRELLAFLQRWSGIFITDFHLNISEIALCVDWLDGRRFGHYRHKFNGFGLWGEIAINRLYLASQPPWEILGTLAHELIHAWQEKHGKPGKNNYHNQEFRRRARRYGLVVDERGRQQYEQNSRFFALLSQYGVDFPKVPSPEIRSKSQTKLKKWSCSCVPPVNVRVAIADFHAQCLVCGQIFRRAL